MFDNLQSTLLDLTRYSNDDLILLRDRINEKLDDLTSINLETELINQLAQVKLLLHDVYGDTEQSASQKAALINSAASIIKELGKTQAEIHNAERVKTMERCLISCLKKKSLDFSEEFITLYEETLGAEL